MVTTLAEWLKGPKGMMKRKLQEWICQYSEYKKVEGMQIPFYVEASWNSESEDAKYAKFKIMEIQYDKLHEF